MRALAWMVLFTGCGAKLTDPCAEQSGTCVALYIDSSPFPLNRIDVRVTNDAGASYNASSSRNQAAAPPIVVALLFQDSMLPEPSSPLTFAVVGTGASGDAGATTTATVARGVRTAVHVRLGDAVPDLAAATQDLAGLDFSGVDLSTMEDSGGTSDSGGVADSASNPDLTPTAPRLIAPLSTSTVTSQQPTFKWTLPPGASDVAVVICHDRACTNKVSTAVTIDVSNTSGSPVAALPAGVLFWHVTATVFGTQQTSATWEVWVGKLTATKVSTSFGTILDVNGDGYADVIAGAYDATNAAGNTGAGRAHLYLGGPSGLSASPQLLDGPDGANAQFGYSVASAGDVNGDGYADVIIGALVATNTAGNSHAGRAHLYLGGPSGLGSSPQLLDGPDGANAFFGGSVASAGDVNGDGYADVIIGAYQATNTAGSTQAGRAHLFLGGPSGLGASAQLLDGPDGANANFGNSVTSAGDVNGDGYADVIIGADQATNTADNTGAGRAHLYLGGPSGLGASPQLLDGPDGANASFGFSVASAGDVNGDGYADVIVGAYQANANAGRAHLYLGGPSGLASSPQLIDGPDSANAFFGSSVASAGDVNSDGYADVIISAYQATNTAGNALAGRAHLYLGGSSGLASSPQLLDGPDGVSAEFGSSVASAGDVNGDGYADVIIGSRGATNTAGNANAGRAHLYVGGASGLAPSPQLLDGPDGASANFGYSVARADNISGVGSFDIEEVGFSSHSDVLLAVALFGNSVQSAADEAPLLLPICYQLWTIWAYWT